MKNEDKRIETVRVRVTRRDLLRVQTIAAARVMTVSDVLREALDCYLDVAERGAENVDRPHGPVR